MEGKRLPLQPETTITQLNCSNQHGAKLQMYNIHRTDEQQKNILNRKRSLACDFNLINNKVIIQTKQNINNHTPVDQQVQGKFTTNNKNVASVKTKSNSEANNDVHNLSVNLKQPELGKHNLPVAAVSRPPPVAHAVPKSLFIEKDDNNGLLPIILNCEAKHFDGFREIINEAKITNIIQLSYVIKKYLLFKDQIELMQFLKDRKINLNRLKEAFEDDDDSVTYIGEVRPAKAVVPVSDNVINSLLAHSAKNKELLENDIFKNIAQKLLSVTNKKNNVDTLIEKHNDNTVKASSVQTQQVETVTLDVASEKPQEPKGNPVSVQTETNVSNIPAMVPTMREGVPSLPSNGTSGFYGQVRQRYIEQYIELQRRRQNVSDARAILSEYPRSQNRFKAHQQAPYQRQVMPAPPGQPSYLMPSYLHVHKTY